MMLSRVFPTFIAIGRWLVRIAPKVGLGLLVLFVLLAIPWTYFNIRWGRELETKLAALKAQGMPLTMAEAAPKDVPDAQNAAVLYQEVFGARWPPAEYSTGREIGGLSRDEEEVLAGYREAPTAELARRAGNLLSRPQVQDDLRILRRASQRPHCVFPINWQDGAGALFPHLAKFRGASRIIAAHALILAKDGHLEEALDWCQVALRMSEHAASEPTIIAQLVCTAMQTISFDAVKQIVSAVEISPATATKLERYLRQIDLYETFTTGMVGERTLLLQEFARIPKNPIFKLDQLTYLRYMGKQIELAGLPYYESRAGHEALEADMAKLPLYQAPLTKILCPVFSRAAQKRGHAVANIGLCRVVLALKAYKYERGAYPGSLAQLQQTLDWQLPEDPFNGQDFVYERRGEGFKLYSVGADLKDSGGQPRDETRPSYKPDGDFDIVWECIR